MANSIPLDTKAIITSQFEHASVLKPLEKIAKTLNIPLKYVELNIDTGINLISLKSHLQKNQNSFVSLSHVNRLTGRLLPIKRVAEICHKNNAVFHSNMSNSFGKFDINLKNLDVDIATFSGANIGIPAIGLFYSKPVFKPKPIILGQKNEYSLVPGTENLPAILLLTDVLKYFTENYLQIKKHNLELKKHLKEELESYNINFSSYGFSDVNFSPYIVSLTLPDIFNFDNFLLKLDLNNIAVSDGRFYELKQHKNLVISFNLTNNTNEIEKFVNVLKKIF